MSKKPELSEFDIQNSLFSRLFQSYHHVIPNYTPLNWWECDLFAVSKDGYFVEYEIKTSAADFYKDSRKTRNFDRGLLALNNPNINGEKNKHDLLASKSTLGPSRFYFVMPEGVISSDEVPDWAGIMRASKFGHRTCVGVERKAPRLHREMVNEAVIHHIQKLFYYRFWNERRKDRGFAKLEDIA